MTESEERIKNLENANAKLIKIIRQITISGVTSNECYDIINGYIFPSYGLFHRNQSRYHSILNKV